ncbi:hypothetical protein Tco_0015351 [Tanacetum coccineum]
MEIFATFVAHQQPVYHPQPHLTHYTQNSSKSSQQAAIRNRGKAIVNSPPPTYDQEPDTVTEDDALSKEKNIDKLMALISLSFKKIYKPTNNNLITSSNTSRANQDNTPRINRETGKGMSEIKTGKGCSLSQGEDDIVSRIGMYMAQIQEVTPDVADNSGPIFDTEPFDSNVIIDSLNASLNGEKVDQDDDLARERT